MMCIALLVFAVVAMGAVLGADPRANLVPRDYQNTTCVLTDDMSLGGANADAVLEAIHQLANNTNKCSADPGLDNCKSLYCSRHSSVKLCNDNTTKITVDCSDLATYVWTVKYDCSLKVPGSNWNGTWGRATDSNGFFVAVEGDSDCV
ncbi:hypothetical protein PG985_015124 [Apiospora marii]|uniref:uncharacterized protein n=1 Tax=Apiospora marii TaxID=335849 RepID=UPI00312F8130